MQTIKYAMSMQNKCLHGFFYNGFVEAQDLHRNYVNKKIRMDFDYLDVSNIFHHKLD